VKYSAATWLGNGIVIIPLSILRTGRVDATIAFAK
jgi:hypothetical protein